MKRTSRFLAILLTLALLFSVTALATTTTSAWPVYGGNDKHNSVVTSAPTKSKPTVTRIGLQNSGSGWTGVDNVPVMQTVDGTTYAYVLYDGHSAGCMLTKVNCNAGTIVWEKQLESTSGFQLSTPLLVQGSDANSEADDTIYAASNGGTVYQISGLDATAASGVTSTAIYTVSAGQINTPITYNNGYIYFGTWIGNGTIEGSTAPGRYYQLKVNDTSDVQSVSSIARGFYWAGAVVYNGYVYFGGDDGYLYYRPAGAGFGTTTDDDIRETSMQFSTVSGDNVRSSVMLDNGMLYFTSQGGTLWCYSVNASTHRPVNEWSADLGVKSTSTPTKVGDRIYVGIYPGFNNGGVLCVTAEFDDDEGTYNVNVADVVKNVAGNGMPVQSSIVVMGDGSGTDYLYFNTNSGTGAGHCYSYDGTTAASVWATETKTYALGGMAIDNGYAVFGNDYNFLYVVHD